MNSLVLVRCAKRESSELREKEKWQRGLPFLAEVVDLDINLIFIFRRLNCIGTIFKTGKYQRGLLCLVEVGDLEDNLSFWVQPVHNSS